MWVFPKAIVLTTKSHFHVKRTYASIRGLVVRTITSGKTHISAIGLPQHKENETAYETSLLCADLFASIGVDVGIKDIDIAHHVPSRRSNLDKKSNPILCKFVRRLSKGGRNE